MTIPPPVPGLIVSFAFLWADDADRGIIEGQKDRPCVVLASYDVEHGKRAILAPITHSEPRNPEAVVAVPAALKAGLGLDDAPAWIICDEWNITDWPGFDLRAAPGRPGGTFHYGMLPPGLYDRVRRLAIRLDAVGTSRKTSRL